VWEEVPQRGTGRVPWEQDVGFPTTALSIAGLMGGFIYSGHENFSESTEEIAPLTEEEKKQRLEELRAKMSEKKARQAAEDKEEQKKNEVGSNPF
jgi:hypothetical protein